MRKALWGALALLLVGCDSGPCPEPFGPYRLSYVEESGNCGPIADGVVNVGGPSTADCTHSGYISADKCTEVIDQSCRQSDGLLVYTEGKLEWDTDGEEAEGTVEYSVPGLDCRSVYTVTVTKL